MYWLPTLFFVVSMIFNLLAIGSLKDKESKKIYHLALIAVVCLVAYFITIPMYACLELRNRLEKLEKSVVLKAESEKVERENK